MAPRTDSVTSSVSAATLAMSGLAGLSFISPSSTPASQEAPRKLALRGGGALASPSQSHIEDSWQAGTAAFAVAAMTLGARRVAGRAPRRAADSSEAAPPPFDPKKEPGVTLPLMYFDPLGFAKEGDEEGFYNLRAAELKHGRVAMLAAIGLVAQHSLRFPGFNDVPGGYKAVITPPGTFGLLALVAASGALEFTIFKQDPEKEPGNFGDPAGLGQYYREWRDRELNNGRFGMIAVLAILFTEAVRGLDAVEQLFVPLGELTAE